MNKIIKDAIILTVITLVAGFCLGFVYDITKSPIEEQKLLRKQESYKKVFQTAADFEIDEKADVSKAPDILKAGGYDAGVINEVMAAKDKGGNTLGYVMSVTTKEGYGGDITFSMGIQSDGTVNGIEILTITETAGLGMKAAEPEFTDQFRDKKVDKFTYTKTGASADNEIDALSGATITTNAVTDGVDAGICFFQSIAGGGSVNE